MTGSPLITRSRVGFLPAEQYSKGMLVSEADLASAAQSSVPFQSSRWTVEPGCCSPIDSHSVHEIWLVARGEGQLVYDGQPTRARAKDIFYFEPPRTHQIFNDGGETLEIFSIWWPDARNI